MHHGYVGYEEGGILIDKVRKRPYSIILFDEIEKAHPDIMNILLQILEEGELTDNQGRKAYFKNTIIILTSNIGANKIISKKRLGFGNSIENENNNNERLKEEIFEELKKEIRPEILNRIDDIVVFNTLLREDIIKIIKLNMIKLINDFKEEEYIIEADENVYEFLFLKLNEMNIIQEGKEEYNARDVRKVIQKYIENVLAENILEEKINKNENYEICVLENEIAIRKINIEVNIN